MQLTRCPTCHARIDLESLIQDAAGRELLGLIAKLPDVLCMPLVTYLGLFRAATRDLANDRALRLALEVLELGAEHLQLAAAMTETVQAMRKKQDEGGFKPLSDHKYLKRVLESVVARPASALAVYVSRQTNTLAAPVKPASKSAQAVELLRNYPAPPDLPEWFVRTVCGALAELVLMSLEGVPAHDTLPMIADRWLTELWPKRAWQKDSRFMGAKRLRDAIIAAAEEHHRWPSVRGVLDRVPTA